MKLLLDQNLSHRLAMPLQSAFAGTSHVRTHHLQEEEDAVIGRSAAAHGLVLVSKDADFEQRALAFGGPPKVIWLRCGNRSTRWIFDLLLRHGDEIRSFA